MAAIALEVIFDLKKHGTVSKGSVVGDKDQTGYLVYPMPPVGMFDLNSVKKILKDFEDESFGDTGSEVRVGTAKTVRKARDKAIRRAVQAYLGQ